MGQSPKAPSSSTPSRLSGDVQEVWTVLVSPLTCGSIVNQRQGPETGQLDRVEDGLSLGLGEEDRDLGLLSCRNVCGCGRVHACRIETRVGWVWSVSVSVRRLAICDVSRRRGARYGEGLSKPGIIPTHRDHDVEHSFTAGSILCEFLDMVELECEDLFRKAEAVRAWRRRGRRGGEVVARFARLWVVRESRAIDRLVQLGLYV